MKLTPALNLTERDVRYVMKHTRNNTDAARFLNINVSTWKRYASLYIDEDSGKSLYHIHTENGTKRNMQKRGFEWKRYPLDGILRGEFPNYNIAKLKDRIIREVVFEEECMYCGYNERRLSDYKVPLRLVFVDGNKKNHKKDNLELICHNCFFHNYGSPNDGSGDRFDAFI